MVGSYSDRFFFDFRVLSLVGYSYLLRRVVGLYEVSGVGLLSGL